jgi:hypothetical protein
MMRHHTMAETLANARSKGHNVVAEYVFGSMLGAYQWIRESGNKGNRVVTLGLGSHIVVNK